MNKKYRTLLEYLVALSDTAPYGVVEERGFESSPKQNFFVKGWLQITKYICRLSVYKRKEKQKLR